LWQHGCLTAVPAVTTGLAIARGCNDGTRIGTIAPRIKDGFNNAVTRLRNEDHDGLVWFGWLQVSVAMVKN